MSVTGSELLRMVLLSAGLAAALPVRAATQNPGSAAPEGNGKSMTIAVAGGPVVLGNGPTQVVCEAKNLGFRVQTLTPNQRIYLVLRELHAAEQPGVLYHLYLDLPQGSQPEKNDPHYVGSLNFFNAVPLEGASAGPDAGLFRSYDLTTLLKNLQQERRSAIEPRSPSYLRALRPSAPRPRSVVLRLWNSRRGRVRPARREGACPTRRFCLAWES